ncbi:MAG: PP2C family protein-serine/threonine phosphatase [Balneolaceae bacterium]
MFYYDTAKEDLILCLLGVMGALLFFNFMGEQHPLRVADVSLGYETAQERAEASATRLGYVPVEVARPKLQSWQPLLDSLQAAQLLDAYEQSDEWRTMVPAFYWSTAFRAQTWNLAETLYTGDLSESSITVRLNERGEMLALQNPNNVLPSRIIDTPLMQQIYPNLEEHVANLSSDTLLFKQFEFDLNSAGLDPATERMLIPGELNRLTQPDARMLANAHLSSTGWPVAMLEFDRAETRMVHSITAADLFYNLSGQHGSPDLELRVSVLPTGSLLELSYGFSDADGGADFTIFGSVVGFILTGFALWVIILLIIRLRLRLVDIKLSVLSAVLAGFIVPGYFILTQLYDLMNGLGTFFGPQFWFELIGIGFIVAVSSLFFFVAVAVGDSITRDQWSQKLRTMDLLRVAHFYNRPIGLAVFRGVILGFLLMGLYALALVLFPDSYLSFSSTFNAQSVLFPYVSLLLSEGALVVMISILTYLILIGKLSSISKKPVFVAVVSGFFFLIVSPFTNAVEPMAYQLALSFGAGLFLGWVYAKYDFLTLVISLFISTMLFRTIGGWVVSGSPDAPIFWALMAVTVALLVYAGFSIFRGASVRELPEFVPDYIKELAADERVKSEIQIAKQVQQSFLPDRTPDVDGYELAAACIPAYETGGDYYDFIPYKDNHYAVAIGDVSGKGIQAAFYMTFTKGVLHALCSDGISGLQILDKINTLFRANASSGTFISLIFGKLDTEQSTFTFARAGHNPLLHYIAATDLVQELVPRGIGIGIAKSGQFTHHMDESVVQLHAGDVLVLFTDGIVEAMNSRSQFYGDKRLHEIIQKNCKLSADEIVQSVLDDVNIFSDGADVHDDMTLLVIKKK